MVIKMLESEYWWGGMVSDGVNMPYYKGAKISLLKNMTENQSAPLFISNKGRYIWSDKPFEIEFREDEIIISNNSCEVIYVQTNGTLRDAYLEACKRHFPPSGKIPDEVLFLHPQYNTWIELLYNQNQAQIIEYAEKIISHGLKPGVIMIDDTWQEDYGVWNFHPGRFPDPHKMVQRLHELGFKVILWICPFVSPDCHVFRKYLNQEDNIFVRNEDGGIAIKSWWNGYSACIDLTSPAGDSLFTAMCDNLLKEYGVDGFKFDAGDPSRFNNFENCYKRVLANEQAEIYVKFGVKYKLNEFRVAWKCGGMAAAQRLNDKLHKWDNGGLGALLPDGLAAGLLGYSYLCPDMIGGGDYADFKEGTDNLDQELFVRYAQASALFPMMQFSAAPWRVLSAANAQICNNMANLHSKFGTYILNVAKNAAETGEPIIRNMEFSYPGCGYELVTDQFMLGEKILVAPVLKKGQDKRIVKFPRGRWKRENGEIIEGSCEKLLSAPLDTLLYFVNEI